MACWLMKSEPDVFGIDDLERRPGQTEPWDGVRNYQARNMIRDDMKVGDQVLFYHSGTDVPGVVGIAEVVREAYPDPTAFDPQSRYHDPRSDPGNPRWFAVDVRFVRRLDRIITLAELRDHEAELGDFPLLRRGNRLSVMPVTPAQWCRVLELERRGG